MADSSSSSRQEYLDSTVGRGLIGIGLSPHTICSKFEAAGIVSVPQLRQVAIERFHDLGIHDPDDRRKLFGLQTKLIERFGEQQRVPNTSEMMELAAEVVGWNTNANEIMRQAQLQSAAAEPVSLHRVSSESTEEEFVLVEETQEEQTTTPEGSVQEQEQQQDDNETTNVDQFFDPAATTIIMCTFCEETKSRNEFSVTQSRKATPKCKTCVKANQKLQNLLRNEQRKRKKAERLTKNVHKGNKGGALPGPSDKKEDSQQLQQVRPPPRRKIQRVVAKQSVTCVKCHQTKPGLHFDMDLIQLGVPPLCTACNSNSFACMASSSSASPQQQSNTSPSSPDLASKPEEVGGDDQLLDDSYSCCSVIFDAEHAEEIQDCSEEIQDCTGNNGKKRKKKKLRGEQKRVPNSKRARQTITCVVCKNEKRQIHFTDVDLLTMQSGVQPVCTACKSQVGFEEPQQPELASTRHELEDDQTSFTDTGICNVNSDGEHAKAMRNCIRRDFDVNSYELPPWVWPKEGGTNARFRSIVSVSKLVGDYGVVFETWSADGFIEQSKISGRTLRLSLDPSTYRLLGEMDPKHSGDRVVDPMELMVNHNAFSFQETPSQVESSGEVPFLLTDRHESFANQTVSGRIQVLDQAIPCRWIPNSFYKEDSGDGSSLFVRPHFVSTLEALEANELYGKRMKETSWLCNKIQFPVAFSPSILSKISAYAYSGPPAEPAFLLKPGDLFIRVTWCDNGESKLTSLHIARRQSLLRCMTPRDHFRSLFSDPAM